MNNRLFYIVSTYPANYWDNNNPNPAKPLSNADRTASFVQRVCRTNSNITTSQSWGRRNILSHSIITISTKYPSPSCSMAGAGEGRTGKEVK
ncbi:hypothetical protein BA6E_11051 [Bacteroidales bacterium 6E]|nr:hypothetical protein BA6E_11051 [Bacteroidales bacterium 6E]